MRARFENVVGCLFSQQLKRTHFIDDKNIAYDCIPKK